MEIRVVIRCGCERNHGEIHFRKDVTGKELDYWIAWRQSRGCFPLVSTLKELSKEDILDALQS
jgi:hypothetical protein